MKTRYELFTEILNDIDIPKEHLERFNEWIEYQIIFNGLGNNVEYFKIDENFENDIEVRYNVKLSN